MNRSLLALLAFLLPPLAHAQVFYDAGTTGNPATAPSPTTQGWSESVTSGSTVGGVSPDPDSPLNAWQLTDPGAGHAHYWKTHSQAVLGTWEAHITAKPVAGTMGILVNGGSLNSDTPYRIRLESVGSDVHVTGEGLFAANTFVVAGASDDYHTYSVRSGSSWFLAEIRFDGNLLGTIGYAYACGPICNPSLGVYTPTDGRGIWRVHRLWLDTLPACPTPSAYCVASTTSLAGCQASITWDGFPSASAPDWFRVASGTVPGATLGICFFGNGGPANMPFGTLGGQICIAPPLFRTLPQASGGTPGACNGYLAFSLQDLQQASSIAVPGASLFAEIWSRDSANPDGFLLSNALQFQVCP